MAPTSKETPAGGPPMGDLNPNEAPDYGDLTGPEAKKAWFEKTFTVMTRDFDASGHEALHAANCSNVLNWARSAGWWPVAEAEFVKADEGDRMVTLHYRVRVVPAGSVDPELVLSPGKLPNTEVPILA